MSEVTASLIRVIGMILIEIVLYLAKHWPWAK